MDDAERALLAAIRAEPDADAPRLVYADWLSQRGDPRGERIVIQCELANPELSDERYDELRRRDGAIAAIHVPDLTLDVRLPANPFAIGDPPPWSRGFVPAETVSCDAERLAERMDDLYRWAPCAQHLRIWNFDDDDDVGRVLAYPDIVRWGGIDRVPLTLAGEVARHANLDALRTITFDADEEEDELVLEPIFAAGRLPNLEELQIRGMMIDGNLAGLPAIADDDWRRAAFASTLRRFDGEMLETLDVFPKLEEYASGFYGGSQFVAIAEFSGRLKRLELAPESASYDPTRPVVAMDALAELLRSPALAQLEVLVLGAERSAPHRVSVWRELDRLPLRMLSLTSGMVTNELVAALIDGPRLPHLLALRLHHYDRQPTNDGIVALANSRAWEHLEELDLGAMRRPTAVIAQLIERLPALRRLRCGTEDLAGVFALAALDKLEVLQLDVDTNTSKWPERPLPRMRLVQVNHRPRASTLYREVVEQWARQRRMHVLPSDIHAASRGEAAATVVRLGRDFDAWRRSFLL